LSAHARLAIAGRFCGLLGPLLLLGAAGLSAGCVGNSNPTASAASAAAPVVNTLALSVDTGPAAATGQINVAYVTVTVCAPGSTTECASIDHVLLDTGSWGLRMVRSVLTAGGVNLTASTDSAGSAIEECVSFVGGQTWGPVALAKVQLAGETAAKLPIQVLDDTNAGAPAPANCGASGTLMDTVGALGANGILGVGVFAQDCGSACVNAATPLPVYYGCTSAGVCTAENVALAGQVTNPVAQFAVDNNGVIVNLPSLVNANGDVTVKGEVIFGLGTQTDNALPTSNLTVLGANASGDFDATYDGNPTVLPALIDSGVNYYAFDDPTIAVCTSAAWVGFYCPAVAPQSAYAINSGIGANGGSGTVNFAIADPDTFVANASAYTNLAGGGGTSTFTWGMPFFYGRKVYVGLDQRAAGVYTGPFYAY
jgi:hypothetical protein